jgi:hypothetical protein
MFIGKTEGRRPLGIPRHRWYGNIKTDLKGIGYEIVDWMYLTQDMDQWLVLVNIVMSLRVP